LGVREFTAERVLNSRFAADIDLFNQAVANGRIYDYEDELFGNKGGLYNTRLTISGGNDRTQFFIGGTYKDEGGIVLNTGYQKTSARLNVNHKFNDWLDASISSNYINSSADRGFFNNDNSTYTMGIALSQTPSFAELHANDDGIYPDNPYAGSNFLQTAATITNNEGIDRFLGGGTLTARIFSTGSTNLRLIVNGGVDYYTLFTKAIFPNTLQFERNGRHLSGVSVQGTTINLNSNLSSFLVLSHFFNNGLSSRTQVGLTQENFDRNTLLIEATDIVGLQTNVDQSGSRNAAQEREIQHDKGFFVQEEVNWEDKLIATLGLRGDKSSNNGDVNKLYYYPKASLALNLHEFDLFSDDLLSQLKLRIAYGQAGNFATFGAKYTQFLVPIVDENPGIEIDVLRGNLDVAPERQKELEFGVDLGFMSNRLLFDATYYIKSVADLLLESIVPTSSGFEERVVNGAELENKGIELGLDFMAVRSTDFEWNTRLSWWKNNAEVTKLLVPSYTTGGFADFLGQFRIKEGHSPTEIIGVGPNPDEDGLVVYGDAEPDFQMSFYNTFRWRNFDLAMLWHWKQGGEAVNLSGLLFDLGQTTHDYDDITLDPDGLVPNGVYRVNAVGSNSQPYIEDAGYIRMREVGLYYTLPENLFDDIVKLKIGFSGTNLINIFDYNSYDPEVSNFGSEGLSSQIEVNPFPSSKRYDFHLIAEF
jgi:outer membrane receptor protein involved in Fe transport